MILCGTGAAAEHRIPLIVDTDAPLAGEAMPVTCGVPLSRARTRDAANLTLHDEQNKPIPVEIQVTARWNDGSIKWVLVDFQVVLEANAPRRLSLIVHDAPPPAPEIKQPIQVTQTNSEITVDTGAMRLTFDRKRPSLLHALSVDLDGSGTFEPQERLVRPERAPASSVRYRVDGWRQKRLSGGRSGPRRRVRKLVRFEQRPAADTYRVTVEHAGRLRVVVRIEGDHALEGDAEGTKDNFVRASPYVMRYELYAGKPYVRAYYSLVYSGDGITEFLRDAVLPYAFSLGGRARAVGAKAAAGEKRYRRLRIVSLGPDRLRVLGQGAEARVEGGGASAPAWPASVDADPGGCIALAGARATVVCAMRDFGKMYPCELEADGPAQTLTVHAWPTHALTLLDGRRYSNLIYQGHYRGERFATGGRSSQGLSFTREFVLDFSLAPPRGRTDWAAFRAQAEARARAHVRKPLGRAAARHLSESGVWGPFAPYEPGRYPRIESLFRLLIDHQIASRRSEGWYGVLDYGDVQMNAAEGRWQMHGRSGWSNGAMGKERGALTMFLRTGERKYFDHYEAMVRHIRDIDTVHFADGRGQQAADARGPAFWRNSASNVGSIHTQGRQHWSGYASELYHTSNGLGFIDHYLLSGDRRSLDAALLTGKFAGINRVGKMLFIQNAYRLGEVCRETEGLKGKAAGFFQLAEEGVSEFNPNGQIHAAYDYQTLPGLLYILADRPHAMAREKLDGYLKRRSAPTYWTAQAFAAAALEGRPYATRKSILRLLRSLTPRKAYTSSEAADSETLVAALGNRYPSQVNYAPAIVWQVPYLMALTAQMTEVQILRPPPRRPAPRPVPRPAPGPRAPRKARTP